MSFILFFHNIYKTFLSLSGNCEALLFRFITTRGSQSHTHVHKANKAVATAVFKMYLFFLFWCVNDTRHKNQTPAMHKTHYSTSELRFTRDYVLYWIVAIQKIFTLFFILIIRKKLGCTTSWKKEKNHCCKLNNKYHQSIQWTCTLNTRFYKSTLIMVFHLQPSGFIQLMHTVL